MSSPIGTFLLLGASGDLSGRLLLPALGQLLDAEPQRRELVLIGAGAEDWSQDAWRERVRSSFAAADGVGGNHRGRLGSHAVRASRRHRREPTCGGLSRPAHPHPRSTSPFRPRWRSPRAQR